MKYFSPRTLIITIKLALLIYTFDLVIYYKEILGDWFAIIVLAVIFSIAIFFYNSGKFKEKKSTIFTSSFLLICLFCYTKIFTQGDPIFQTVKAIFNLETYQTVLTIVAISSFFLIENITLNLVERKEPFKAINENRMNDILDNFE